MNTVNSFYNSTGSMHDDVVGRMRQKAHFGNVPKIPTAFDIMKAKSDFDQQIGQSFMRRSRVANPPIQQRAPQQADTGMQQRPAPNVTEAQPKVEVKQQQAPTVTEEKGANYGPVIVVGAVIVGLLLFGAFRS